MQLLILAHTLDRGAEAVATTLSQHSGAQVLLLRPEWLGQAAWSQRVSRHGRAQTRLRCPGLVILDAAQIGLVWNRARWLPQAHFRESNASDRDYASSELHALVLSFLAELGSRVVPAMRQCPILDAVPPDLAWMMAATTCGLGIADIRSREPEFHVLVTPDRLVGPHVSSWSAEQVRACHALAERLGFAIAELGFVGGALSPHLCQVDVHPDLTSAEEVHAVAQWLLRHAQHPAESGDSQRRVSS